MIKWLKKKCFPNKPKFATMEEWVEWHKEEKKKPFCNWIVNTVPRWFRVKQMHWHDFMMWFQYRLNPKHKYHLINTGLKPNYYNIDLRMLHGMFNMLKEFVEKELAYNHWCCSDPKTRGKFVPGKEAGLKSIAWQKDLVYRAEEVGDRTDLIGKPTDQALYAKELEELYLWWVEKRPARKDPRTISDPLYAKTVLPKTAADIFESVVNRSDEEKELARKLFEQERELQEEYDKEDEEMMIRLIKIRKSMWT